MDNKQIGQQFPEFDCKVGEPLLSNACQEGEAVPVIDIHSVKTIGINELGQPYGHCRCTISQLSRRIFKTSKDVNQKLNSSLCELSLNVTSQLRIGPASFIARSEKRTWVDPEQ